MLTGGLRNQIDGIWNDFWSGGLANPLQVIEQITYLIFIKRLDEMQELEERKATTLGKPVERRIFPEGHDGIAKPGDPDQRGEPYPTSVAKPFKMVHANKMTIESLVFDIGQSLDVAGAVFLDSLKAALASR